MGELLGLRWRALDLDAGAVRVLASLQRTAAGLVIAEPKTARSRRQIEIEPRVVATLRRHRAAQLQERLAAGPVWAERDLVFTTRTGGPIDDVTRSVALVAPEELELAILHIVEDQFGYPREALPHAVAEAFGFERSGAASAELIASAVDALVERGLLRASGPNVSLA